MQSQLVESLDLVILKTFPFDEYEKIKNCGNSRAILSSMLELESAKKEFGLQDILQQMKKGKQVNGESIVSNDVSQVLRKLCTSCLLLTQKTNGLYTFADDVPNGLREFLSLTMNLAILKTFPPDEYEKIRYGGSYWVMLSSMLELESDKKEFSLQDILQQMKKGKQVKDESLEANNVSQVLRKLCTNGLLLPQNTKGLYKFADGAPDALCEFLGLRNYTRRGKSGLVRYLSYSDMRIVLWYCLCHANLIEVKKVELILDEIKELKPSSTRALEYLDRFVYKKNYLTRPSRFTIELWNEVRGRISALEYLDRFCKNNYLNRVDSTTYKLPKSNVQIVLDKLLSGYNDFAMPKLTLRGPMQIAIEQHEKVSGKMIREDLAEMEHPFDDSYVYKEIKKLVEKGGLKETEIRLKAENGPGVEKFYEVKFSDPMKHNEVTLERIKTVIEHCSFSKSKESSINKEAWDRFSEFAKNQKPNSLEVFLRELRWGFLLRSQDQTASIALWLSFFNQFQNKELYNQAKAVDALNAEQDPLVIELERISQEYKISPLAVVLLYASIVKGQRITA
jgi:hypothetical protein